jgi:hypothetical protein
MFDDESRRELSRIKNSQAIHNLRQMNWFHGAPASSANHLMKTGLEERQLPELGQVPARSVYGPGFYTTTDPELALDYASNPEHFPKEEGAVVSTKLTAKNPLLYGVDGHDTPGIKEIARKTIEAKRASIQSRVESGQIIRPHGDYLNEKLDILRDDVEHGWEQRRQTAYGHIAPHAGFDAYITNADNADSNGLIAVTFHPRAVRLVGVHNRVQFSDLMKKKED